MAGRDINMIISLVCLVLLIGMLIYVYFNVEAIKSNPCHVCEKAGYTCIILRPYFITDAPNSHEAGSSGRNESNTNTQGK